MVNKKTIAFTIIAQNYFPQASVLAESYVKYHPDHQFYIFFVDNQTVKSPYSIPIKRVNTIKNIKSLAFKYNITEFSTAVKPPIFLWLIKTQKPDKILYIDPDICFYQKITPITKLLDKHDCVLIPHRTQPTNDDKKPDEWDFMGCGYYNLGFAAFKNNPQTRNFIGWWADKLKDYAYSDTQKSMFTDQKWMDYAPSFLNTHILKQPGYDVAYWNLHEYLNKFPSTKVKFFHFSGFVPQQNLLSKHQNRFSLNSVGSYKKLFDDYGQRLAKVEKKYPSLSRYRYPYESFDNQIPVTPEIKRIFRHLDTKQQQKFPDPFNTNGSKSFLNFLLQPIQIDKDLTVLNYFLLLYHSQPEIQTEFILDRPYSTDQIEPYINWCLTFSKAVYQTPKKFLDIQKKLTPNLVKFRYGPKFNLNQFQTVFSLEKTKSSRSNSAFINSVYRILLHRYPDYQGFQRSLTDLEMGISSRNLLIYRTLNSQEFKLKSSNDWALFVYKIYLLLFSLLYLAKQKIIKNYSQPEPQLQISPTKIPSLPPIGINLSGYLDTESGVGEVARNMAKTIKSASIPLNINLIEQEWLRRQDHTFQKKFTNNHQHPINLICVNADQLPQVIENQLKPRYLNRKYNIGYWHWESNIFPDQYISSFTSLNEVWTATTYVQQAVSYKSPIPVVCIPPAFPSISSKQLKKFNYQQFNIKITPGDFIFVNIFDSASFWQRKNPFGLIQAFNQAFPDSPNTKLIIKTTQISKSNIYPKLKKEIDKNKNIFLIDQYLSPKDFLSLLNSADCYIQLHRAEGLGVPLIQSHLLGKPVIATNFSANTDFETDFNSFLVDHQPYILQNNLGPYPAGTTWADADLNHAAQQMQKVRSMNPKQLRKISQKGKNEVGHHFSTQRVGQLIKNRLKIINQLY